MALNKSSKVSTIARLRDIRIPEDYVQIANLFNMIEPGSATAQSIEEEDQQMPITSNLKLNEHGLLVGFGRTRVIAEDENGQIIGYGASYRAPWADPGQLGSVFCVHPEYRGQGVGEMILSHIENWAKEQQASVLSSIVMDWIDASIPFVQNRGFSLDAHVFDLVLDLNQFDSTKYVELREQLAKSGIQFVTLADLPGEDSEHKLYELCVETSRDNPGQYESLPPFAEWRKEFLPEDSSRKDWVFIAIDGNHFVGVTQLFSTEDAGVVYTNYTGVQKEYRGRGIAKALKRISIDAAKNAGANTMTTDSEESNAPMQYINRSIGYIPGKGHYRILKKLNSN
ncbi:GNAT family N-acetyltransferase [Bacillus sp. DTU_2020_1000418_1_SI_GHA_SEK_038]|uniref:GNAT family N-acetyltransferase n=1 Tax=Bacillus sp. DTU_2020_1000418_1_SI_GHA_SEK_038 TaxID=3077585 RepID=UPI0028EC3DE7|nr:GNAT family N-acetyltransferase [Bacillus sp. DTU_2020_1000418_1_SI_GHA_SEK_038]WNS75435.1 GNAT family N-acetyltransferase [Bacillus sp. DTU_2020_1000418_1_SI_GHA_SEK_038]